MSESLPKSLHAVHVLMNYLRHQETRGVSEVWISKEAQKQLYGLPGLIMKRKLKGDLPVPEARIRETSPVMKTQDVVSPPAPLNEVPKVATPEPRTPSARPEPVAKPQPVAAPQPVSPPVQPSTPVPPQTPVAQPNAPAGEALIAQGKSKAAKLNYLFGLAQESTEARALGTLRDTMVFAVGRPKAEIVFVGEAPGFEEEKQQMPFVGPAGQLLTKIIEAMGLQRETVYISNVVKFRPKIGNGEDQSMRNRTPTDSEIAASRKFVLAEIEVIQPKVIVALGGSATFGLLGRKESVGKMRSQFHDLNGTPLMVTYHPSYLLRTSNNTEKRKLWEDMLMVMQEMKMNITAKQQGYFLQKNRRS